MRLILAYRRLLLVLPLLSTLSLFSQAVLYSEDFESSSQPLSGFVLSNLDKGTVVETGWTSLTDSAWVIRDLSGLNTRAAIATSVYEPIAEANDWLITPAILIGKASHLSWDAISLSAVNPDSYQVYVSTSNQSVNGCLLNFPVMEVEHEVSGNFAHHEIDLASLGFENQAVYIGFRLNTAEAGDKLALDNIRVMDDSIQSTVSLTFKVDMSKYITAGNFNPATDTVDIAGSFNAWDGTNHIMTMDPESDSTKYTITIPGFYEGNSIEFKFRINSSWNDTAVEFPYGGPNRYWKIQNGLYTFTAYYNEQGVISAIDDHHMVVEKFLVFPNPAEQWVRFSCPDVVSRISLIGINGSVVREWPHARGIQEENIADISPGYYLIVFYQQSNRLASRKLMIR
jgi:hypothetical protein